MSRLGFGLNVPVVAAEVPSQKLVRIETASEDPSRLRLSRVHFATAEQVAAVKAR